MSSQFLAEQSSSLYVDLYVEDYEGIYGYADYMTKLATRTEADMTSPAWNRSLYAGSVAKISDLSFTYWPHIGGKKPVKSADNEVENFKPQPLHPFR